MTSEAVLRPAFGLGRRVDDDDDGQSIGSTIAELLNESFDSDSDSELKYLDWDDEQEDDVAANDEAVDDEDDLSYAEYEEILCGLRRWIEAARERDEDEEEGKTLIVGELSPTEGLFEEGEDRRRNATSSDKLPAAPLHMSEIMKGESCNSSAHSATAPPASTQILQSVKNSAEGNTFCATQLSPSPQKLFLTPPGYSAFVQDQKPAHPPFQPEPTSLEDLPGRFSLSVESSSNLVEISEAVFTVRPVFGAAWSSPGTSTVTSVPSSSATSLPAGEYRRTNQSLADFWEERVGYKRSLSDGDKPSFRPFNPTYYYYPESSRKALLFATAMPLTRYCRV